MILFTLNARWINFSNPGPLVGGRDFLVLISGGCLFWKDWWEMVRSFVNSKDNLGRSIFIVCPLFTIPCVSAPCLIAALHITCYTYYCTPWPPVFTGDQRDKWKHVSHVGFLLWNIPSHDAFHQIFLYETSFNLGVVSICSLLFTGPNLQGNLRYFYTVKYALKINSLSATGQDRTPAAPREKWYINV